MYLLQNIFGKVTKLSQITHDQKSVSVCAWFLRGVIYPGEAEHKTVPLLRFESQVVLQLMRNLMYARKISSRILIVGNQGYVKTCKVPKR